MQEKTVIKFLQKNKQIVNMVMRTRSTFHGTNKNYGTSEWHMVQIDDLCTFDNKGKKQFDFKKAKLLLEDDNFSAIQRPHIIRFIELVCEGRKNFKEHKDKFDKRKKKQVNQQQVTVRNVERKIRCDQGRKKLTRYSNFTFISCRSLRINSKWAQKSETFV